jgi:hypothetical protein
MLSTIRRILMSLAVLGLVLAPMARPAMALPAGQSGGMDHQAMMSGMADHEMTMPESMPCCPDEAPVPMSDCGKLCAMMMCAFSLSPTLPSAAWIPVLQATATELLADGGSPMSGRVPAPPPRPPKA